MYFVVKAMSTQFEEMSAENSTANETLSNTTNALLDHSTEMAAFSDPSWQLAITIEFYFRYAVLAVAIFGTATNATVLYALIAYNANEAKKRAVNLLIIHQNVIDLSSCILLVIAYSIGNKTDLTGALGDFLCIFFISANATYWALYASVINLMSLTIERYLKVVYPFWSKKHIKRWMIYAAMIFAWVIGFPFTIPVGYATSFVQDGICFIYHDWESEAVKMTFGAFTNVVFFLLPMIIFIYCYGHIVVVMRRQMRVMAAHNVEGSSQMNASQIQSKRVKWNIIKTMIIVSVAFVICWFPNNVYFMIMDTTETDSLNLYIGYFPTMFLVYFNVCINPFIYATKHEGVKQKLARLMICSKCKGPTAVGDSSKNSTNNAGRMQQTPAGSVRA